MHSELHGNVVYHGVELLLLVSMLFLLAIPKSFLILKEFLYTSLYRFCISKDYGYSRLILALTNTPSLNYGIRSKNSSPLVQRKFCLLRQLELEWRRPSKVTNI